MRLRLPSVLLLLAAVGLSAVASSTLAGTSGKVSGEVIDAETGEPVVGATVRIQGTNYGTKTDADGEFFIINLPVGKHNISVTSVGYEEVVKMEVRVLLDLTTPVDFELSSKAVELGDQVIVFADQPIVQRDLTSSRTIFTADQMQNLPNNESVHAVLKNYPGVVVGRDSDIHVRGGRSGEVAYYYDGFSVQDPFFASSGIRIMPSALEELSLTSGGYTAEYGEALSGIVNAVTREGGAEYHGGLRFYEGATHPYDVTTGTWGSLSRVGNRAVAANLSGPLPGLNPKKFNFFTAGEYLTNATSLPHNDGTSYTWLTKLSLQPVRRMKMTANATVYDVDGYIYDHRDANGISYDFNLDGLPAFRRDAYVVGLTGTYNFSERLLVHTTLNRFRTYTKVAPEHLMDVYWTEWPGYDDSAGQYTGTIHEDNYLGYYDPSDVRQAVGFTVGDDFDPTFSEREATYNAGSASMVVQLNKVHQIKTGFEVRRYSINWDFKQFYNRNPYGEKYSTRPLLASAYLQDKMEYSDFVVNLGLRLDYRNADIAYNVTPQDAVATYKNAESKTRLSPRLGISFPISEKSVMHFNYGFYYQAPQYHYMYTNLDGDISTGRPLLGNPDLEPEQTTSYELGLNHLVGDNLRLYTTAYYKDIEDLVTTRSTYKVAGNSVTYFTNGDYGSVKGVDVMMELLKGDRLISGSVSYGYMIATGNGSDALEPYYTYLSASVDTLAPVTEYPLDFDQRHTVTAELDIRAPREWRGSFLGLPIPGAWGLNLIGRYGSGLPYTPTDASGNRLNERNQGRLPAYYTVDMRFNKDFDLSPNGWRMSFFVEVDNLFDRRNVVDVYSLTGQPDDDGYSQQASLSLSQEELDEMDRLYDHDPQNFSSPRTIRVGTQLNF